MITRFRSFIRHCWLFLAYLWRHHPCRFRDWPLCWHNCGWIGCKMTVNGKEHTIIDATGTTFTVKGELTIPDTADSTFTITGLH